ncbi:MAG: ccmE [Acidimicrobiaceae bacterium]|nr:MAG: ccmE [Acidimicrobiaceae bacterium]
MGSDKSIELSPRQVVPTASRVRARGRRWPALAVLALVFIGGGVVVTKFLSSAIDYYCNVDEVGVKDGCEAGRRLRVQGNVEEGTVASAGGVTTFAISFNGVEMVVRYVNGDPGGIFQECVPVVVHGRLVDVTAADGTVTLVFEGDHVDVKHSNEYAAANDDRLDQAEAACSLPA